MFALCGENNLVDPSRPPLYGFLELQVLASWIVFPDFLHIINLCRARTHLRYFHRSFTYQQDPSIPHGELTGSLSPFPCDCFSEFTTWLSPLSPTRNPFIGITTSLPCDQPLHLALVVMCEEFQVVAFYKSMNTSTSDCLSVLTSSEVFDT